MLHPAGEYDREKSYRDEADRKWENKNKKVQLHVLYSLFKEQHNTHTHTVGPTHCSLCYD